MVVTIFEALWSIQTLNVRQKTCFFRKVAVYGKLAFLETVGELTPGRKKPSVLSCHDKTSRFFLLLISYLHKVKAGQLRIQQSLITLQP